MTQIITDTEESPYDDINKHFEENVAHSDYASIMYSAHEMAMNAHLLLGYITDLR
jgi:hypothetical protein